MKVFLSLKNIYEKINLYLLASVVIVMLFLTLLNIFLRLFEGTLLWIEPVVRHLVFFSAFLGGAVASSNNEHIKIDLASKLIKGEKLNTIYQFLISLFSLVVLYYLYQSGINFYEVEKEYASKVFLGINSSTLVFIIPLGFLLISIQTILNLIEALYKAMKRTSNE